MPARSSSEEPAGPPERARSRSGGAAPSRLQIYAATAATLALIASAVALVRSTPGSSPAPAAPSTNDAAALRRDLDDLRRRVSEGRGSGDPATAEALRRLVKRVEALESGRPSRPADTTDPEGDPAPPVPTTSGGGDKAPLYSKLVVPQKGVTVRDTGGGSLAVTNTDPALTGQMVTVTATRVDGTTEEVRLVIPAP